MEKKGRTKERRESKERRRKRKKRREKIKSKRRSHRNRESRTRESASHTTPYGHSPRKLTSYPSTIARFEPCPTAFKHSNMAFPESYHLILATPCLLSLIRLKPILRSGKQRKKRERQGKVRKEKKSKKAREEWMKARAGLKDETGKGRGRKHLVNPNRTLTATDPG